MIQNQKAHTNSSQYVVKFANKEPKKIPDLVLKNLFSLIYIHKPKSYELFCNILEDFNFGDLLKLDIFNQFMEFFLVSYYSNVMK